jgi:oligopeptide transport system substrate-binding protein
MLRNQRLALLITILAALAAAMAGCLPGARTPGGTIHLNLGAEPPTLDPALAEDPSSIQADELLFLSLTDLDEDTMEPVPELATGWQVSQDGLVWTFQLRKDVNWVHYDPASGRLTRQRPVTAHDVEFSIKRALDPATASSYAYVLFIIKNGEAYNSGKISDPAQVGVRAVGDYTVEFTLEHPASYFPAITALWVTRPAPKELIDQFGYKWVEPGNIWTNGPYALAGWEHEASMTMVKNTAYYNARNVAIERIEWAMIRDGSAAFAQYKEGKLDVCDVPADELQAVRADPALSQQVRVIPYLATFYLGFNNSKPPFDNKLVRQAFSYALDRRALIDTVLKGEQRPAVSFAGPGVFGSPASDPAYKGVEYNPDLARKLLAEAGYPDGKGFPQVTLAYYTSQLHRQVAEFAQKNWHDVLGVDVKLDNLELRVYLKALNEDTPQIFSSVWTPDYPDEDNWVFQNFDSAKGANRIRWQNAEFDRLVEQARVETDAQKRRDLYKRAEQILCVDEAAIVPVFHSTHIVCTKPYVARSYSPFGNEHIDKWSLRR